MKKRWQFFLLFLLLLLSTVSARAESWEATPVGPPDGRCAHTDIWTGSRMIVWGGYDGSGYLRTGGRYIP